MMIYKSLSTRLFLLFSFVFLTFNYALADEVSDKGKALFKVNCKACHNANMIDGMTGPALGGTNERWEGREDLLYQWIRNSAAVVASGDSYAVKMFNDNNKIPMTPFPNLTDEEINAMLVYIQCIYDKSCGPLPPVVNGGGVAVAVEKESDNTLLYVTLFIILGILAMVLARIIYSLNRIAATKEGERPAPAESFFQSISNSGIIGFLIFGVVIFGGYTTVSNAINLGRQQGYQPTQPIKFSHKTHAGVHKIDCQYCHDGARRSKHSIIPAANTCMNCHSAINKGSTYGTAEISKIYASVGYNPNTKKYIENYDQMPEEDIEKIFKEWIGSNNDDDKEVLDQWNGIKNSLTNDSKSTIPGPIEWIRVHNLPDHVYYNHSQHVTVGKLECQTCHGPVEKMDVVEQYSPLSMGWCVNCHRETSVAFKDNPYYETYEKYHEEFKAGKRDKVTVEEIGGLECQKCHY